MKMKYINEVTASDTKPVFPRDIIIPLGYGSQKKCIRAENIIRRSRRRKDFLFCLFVYLEMLSAQGGSLHLPAP